MSESYINRQKTIADLKRSRRELFQAYLEKFQLQVWDSKKVFSIHRQKWKISKKWFFWTFLKEEDCTVHFSVGFTKENHSFTKEYDHFWASLCIFLKRAFVFKISDRPSNFENLFNSKNPARSRPCASIALFHASNWYLRQTLCDNCRADLSKK